MDAKIRVLHLLCSNQWSGAENVVSQLIAAFRGAPYEMAYASPDGPIREALKARGIAFVPMKEASAAGFRQAIREWKPDILHAHDMRAGLLSALAAPGLPMVSHIHNNSFDSRKLTPKTLGYWYAARRAGHIFWVSQAAMDGFVFAKQFRKKSSVLRNMIDPAAIQRRADAAAVQDAHDFVYLGRLSYPKDPVRLAGVLGRALEVLPEATAAIIGGGELEEETRAAVQALPCADRIVMTGFQPEPYGMLAHAKAMVMTSRWEGLPMCALEAMALGVPIVSTPTDGLREVVSDGENGFLSPDDGVLADRLAALASDTGLRARLSAAAVRRSEEINDAAAYRQQVEAAYHDALRGRRH